MNVLSAGWIGGGGGGTAVPAVALRAFARWGLGTSRSQFAFKYSHIPSFPPSRPNPDSRYPPNPEAASNRLVQLTHTTPALIFGATSSARLMFSVHTLAASPYGVLLASSTASAGGRDVIETSTRPKISTWAMVAAGATFVNNGGGWKQAPRRGGPGRCAIPSCPGGRDPAQHPCPWLNQVASPAPSTTLSKAASANTVDGLSPPGAGEGFLPDPAGALRMMRPASVEPVNAILSMSG